MSAEEELERKIYSVICRSEGIKAKEIAALVHADRTTVNRLLYGSRYMQELCYADADYCWHGMIRQNRPHIGLGAFSGWYGTAEEFLAESEEEWFSELCSGCEKIGRNLNDTRGLFHSFRDSRNVMRNLFSALDDFGCTDYGDWELCFELRINRAKYIRIYADVLLITHDRVFSLEFKMKREIDPEEVAQAAKYCGYLEVLFGQEYDIIPALVLTAANDLYTYAPIRNSEAEIPVASGDMLFNLLDEYLGIIRDEA